MHYPFKKIAIAMSGGVDSSVAAALLKDQGYEVAGFTIKTWDCDDPSAVKAGTKTCCSNDDVNDARAVANKIGIPFYVVDAEQVFQEKVVKPFEEEYSLGRTPIPCTNCNEYIKWGYLYEQVRKLGFEAVATGHFAKLGFDENTNRHFIIQGDDALRDQSFFLFSVPQENLKNTVFPVGDLTKEEVRKIAERYDLSTADKPGSMDICFVKGGSYADKIKVNMSDHEGEVWHVDGRLLGAHQGLFRYTIGQRKGLGIADKEPLYVTKIDKDNKRIFLGPEEALLQSELLASHLTWGRLDQLNEYQPFYAKIRYRQTPQPCVAKVLANGQLHVKFNEPVRAITPGQAVVLYDSESAVCLGGWIINHIEPKASVLLDIKADA